jgi:hypothetical protein
VATANGLMDFAAVDYELETLVLQWLAEVGYSQLPEERVQRVSSRTSLAFKKMLRFARSVPLLQEPLHMPNEYWQWPNCLRINREACFMMECMVLGGSYISRHRVSRDATVSAGSWAMASAKRKGRCVSNCSVTRKGNYASRQTHATISGSKENCRQ